MVETVADAALPAAGAIVAVIAPAAAPPAASNTVEKHFQIGLLHAIWLRDPDFFWQISIKSLFHSFHIICDHFVISICKSHRLMCIASEGRGHFNN